MVKKQNKRRVASLVLCGALLAGFALSPAVASAEETTENENIVEGTGSKEGPLVNGKLSHNPMKIPIKASTSGSDIKYYIEITPGDMTFSYSYGKTWNPGTHSYAAGSESGWASANLNGTNNAITVNNKSNYPVIASFKVEDPGALKEFFNSKIGDPGNYPSDAVRGVFSTENTDFITAGGVVNVNDPDKLNTFKDTADMPLEMNANSATVSSYHRMDQSIAKTNEDACVGIMYFALAGKPTKTVEESTEVGNIVVTIAPPATGVHLVEPPSP